MSVPPSASSGGSKRTWSDSSRMSWDWPKRILSRSDSLFPHAPSRRTAPNGSGVSDGAGVSALPEHANPKAQAIRNVASRITVSAEAAQESTTSSRAAARSIQSKSAFDFFPCRSILLRNGCLQAPGRTGIKLILMDKVPHRLQPGKDYVTVVASDNEQNAKFATEELVSDR